MKIAIIGYGKMGKVVEEAARTHGHETGLIIDLPNQSDLTPANLRKNDVAIEFSTPTSAYANISACFNAGIPVVCGTTGWQEKMKEIRERCERENKAMVYSSNFSLGVNILFFLNKKMAEIMNRFDDYQVSLQEIHHIMKKDAPSGTAIKLAEDIISRLDRKKSWTMNADTAGDTIPVKAIRADDIFGIHEISYQSENDKLVLKHTALNRKGFAAGVILAAEFIRGRTGFYSMQELLQF
jgi:4-hydroxy-tetrahydrodipicolinate reductase